MKFIIICCFLLYFIPNSICSAGDQSPYYQRCVENCAYSNCSDDWTEFLNNDLQPFYLKLLHWTCEDECNYECMWKTVEAFQKRKWRTPQFFGKWPFIRMYGIQEPASVLFSIGNFYAHFRMLQKFRHKVSRSNSFYWLWHAFGIVSLNAWIWSTIFHTRDFPLTEFMDYTCAFTLVLISCYCMIIRLLKDLPRFALITVTTFFVAFLANHIAYLKMTKFDYGYNMQLNIVIGTFTAISWFGWSTYNRIRKPYVWKCAIFVSLAGLVMLLEVIDVPPFFWIFDCHSLWHLATIPLTCLFYSFIIDDCQYLEKAGEAGGGSFEKRRPLEKKHKR